MKPMIEVFPSVSGMMIYTSALILIIVQFGVLLLSLYKRDEKQSLFLEALFFIISFLVVGLMLIAANAYKILDPGEELVPGSLPDRIFALPWVIFAAWDIFEALMVLSQIRQHTRYAETHLTQDAVKETLDWLPVGICISDEQGTVMLSNLIINELSQSLTNKHLFDSLVFWKQVEEQGTAQDQGYLLRMQDGRAWLFTKKTMNVQENGQKKQYTQIFAEEMTEVCNITDELSARNKHLKDVQLHMKAVAAYEKSLISAREVIKARTAVHNQMGSVLLSGKYYMDHPNGMDETELIRLLEYNNFFLLREAENQEKEADALDKALKTAQRIRVTVEIEGTLPEQESARDILAQAVEQCAANTVRHAGGDCVYVTLTETGSRLKAVFRNNGKAPEQPVNETGGLLYLRKIAEAAGGTVSIQSEPEFVLTVCIPIQ